MGKIFLLTMMILVIGFSSIPQLHSKRIPITQMICDGGFCKDGQDHILDCSFGVCIGDGHPQNFPTIVPAFDTGDWLDPDDRVIGVIIDNIAKAYPLRIMNFYETVIDEISKTPLLISYCPVCGSGIAYSRMVDGKEIVLLNSGELWKLDLVLYDKLTKSRWNQIAGKAINGEFYGTQLDFIQSSQVMWEDWKELYPDTLVMARPIDEKNNFIFNFDSKITLPKQQVYGIVINDQSIAFPFDIMKQEKLINLEIFAVQLTIVFGSMDISVFNNNGSVLELVEEDGLLRSEDGSLYSSISGQAIDPLRISLVRIDGKSMKLFAWEDFFPNSIIYIGNGKFETHTASDDEISGFSLQGTIIVFVLLGITINKLKRFC